MNRAYRFAIYALLMLLVFGIFQKRDRDVALKARMVEEFVSLIAEDSRFSRITVINSKAELVSITGQITTPDEREELRRIANNHFQGKFRVVFGVEVD